MVHARLTGSRAVKRRARWLREHSLCVHCKKQGYLVAAEEVDHVVPIHKGGKDDESNFQSLCKRHHANKSIKERGWIRRAGCNADGVPNDPEHPWNK